MQIYVSTHSRPKAAGYLTFVFTMLFPFQLTAARRRLEAKLLGLVVEKQVSTHSRPKAAGITQAVAWALPTSFNSQPPEGGWLIADGFTGDGAAVSTHSRPKAAGVV